MKNAMPNVESGLAAFKVFEHAMDGALKYREKLLKGFEVFSKLDLDEINATPKDLVLQIDKMKLYHYKPLVKNPVSPPLLLVYALMNKQYIMDIQQDKSFVKKLLELGMDIYIIDWGYPTAEDKYITTEDYIESYLDAAVNLRSGGGQGSAAHLCGQMPGRNFRRDPRGSAPGKN